MNAPVIDLEPVSLEAEIAEVFHANIARTRSDEDTRRGDAERRKWDVFRRYAINTARRNGYAVRFFSLAFVGTLAVAWIAEQRLAVL